MVYCDNEGSITLTRGDSLELPLFLNAGTDLSPIRYHVKEGQDQVVLALMEPNQPFEQAILHQTYTSADVNENGDILVRFDPPDTQLLLPGLYYYEIKLFRDGGSLVDTVVPVTRFYIVE